jgi:aerobic-type carbon monoxide dehydrogenase small subunit (CoxS/CutS family)
MRLTVNGIDRELALPPLETLLHALREGLGLTSPKAGCQEGGCGACTVLVDGEPRRACLTPLVAVDGSSVTTVEGLGEPGNLSPVQAAFHEQYGAQCGFCTPGFVLATTALLDRSSSPGRDEILAELGGHVCRCTGYVKIVAAVEAAARGDISDDALRAGATGRSRGEPEVVVTGSPA